MKTRMKSLAGAIVVVGLIPTLVASTALSGTGSEQQFRGRWKSPGDVSSAAESSSTSPSPAPSSGTDSTAESGAISTDSDSTKKPSSNVPQTATAKEPESPETKGLKTGSDPCAQKAGMDKQALQQVGEYCAAAKASEKAASNQKLLGGVHAGVAGICLIPCLASVTVVGMSANLICAGAALGAGATDIVVTKNFGAAVGVLMGGYGVLTELGVIGGSGAAAGGATAAGGSTGAASGAGGQQAGGAGGQQAGGAGGQQAGGAGGQKGAEAGKEGGKGKKALACFTAAVEAGMSVMNFMGAKESKKTADANRQQARELVSGALVTPEGTPGSVSAPIAAGALGSSSKGSVSSAGGPSEGLSSQNSGRLNPLLESSKSCSGGVSNQLNCMAASGVPLPPAAKSRDFIPTLEKLSGMSVDKLMSKGDTAGIMGAVASPILNEKGKAHLEDIVAKATEALRAEGSTAYASSGHGGGSSGGGDPMAALNKAMGDMMDGMNKKSEDASDASKSEKFAKAEAPAQAGTEEDRSISLFDRVSRRYFATRERLVVRQYTSPENRALTR